jgi:chromosome partitioning protein
MRRIIVLNQKGGVGKTTTVANLGACLAELGRRVLMVDVDPQANLSLHFGVDIRRGEPSLYDLIRGDQEPQAVVRCTSVDGLCLLPGNVDLAGLSVELPEGRDRLFALRTALEGVAPGFDYVLMDLPPSLGLLTLNAMCAADEVFVTLQTEFFALQGVGKLLGTVQRVRQINNRLRVSGVVACMYDSRTCLAHEILSEIRKHFGRRVFDTVVRTNIRLAEAPGFGLPIIQYDEACHGAQDYRALAREVVAMEVSLSGGPSMTASDGVERERMVG